MLHWLFPYQVSKEQSQSASHGVWKPQGCLQPEILCRGLENGPSSCVRPAVNSGCPELSVLGSHRSSALGRAGSSLSHSVGAAPALLPRQALSATAAMDTSSTADRSQNHTAHAPLSDKHQLFPGRAVY